MAQFESQTDDVVLSTLDRDDESSITSNSADNVSANDSDVWYEVSAATTDSSSYPTFSSIAALLGKTLIVWLILAKRGKRGYLMQEERLPHSVSVWE
jgi:hypothetical protein